MKVMTVILYKLYHVLIFWLITAGKNFSCHLYNVSAFCSLFQFSPRKNQQREDTLSPYSLSPVSAKSQKLLRSPRKAARKISKIPFKVCVCVCDEDMEIVQILIHLLNTYKQINV